LVPRYGGAVGAGAGLVLNDKWSARVEYLFIDYASRDVSFPVAAQHFDASLVLHTIRLGLDYKLGEKAVDQDFTKGITALELNWFAFHGQITFIEQYAAPFRSPYIGPQSLSPNQGRESLDFMYFIGVKLWKGAEFWIDPEFNQGFGLSNTKGIAGFPSGASFKVGSAVPYARIQRFFLRQTIDLGGKTQKVEADQNQFAGSNTTDRLVITVGKFSISDIFDQNKYAQNPRKDFMNWAVIDAGSYDYAADAWGYTYGAAAEWYRGPWSIISCTEPGSCGGCAPIILTERGATGREGAPAFSVCSPRALMLGSSIRPSRRRFPGSCRVRSGGIAPGTASPFATAIASTCDNRHCQLFRRCDRIALHAQARENRVKSMA
jgi:high affinity Mn2+ porin